MVLTHAEMGYHANLCEIAIMEYVKEDFHLDFEVAGVDAGIGGGFTHTQELKDMKYNEAMKTNHKIWAKTVEEEHDRMVKNLVWTPVN
eukprot:9934192-Ditylum_brightwellii.AAC.1